MSSVNPTQLRFQDKVAIVTGGCKGIGRGCVDVLVENGGKVAVFDIDDTTGNSLTVPGPGEVYFVHCDVTKEEQVEKAIESTVSHYGKIDCLVNNAGWHPGASTIDGFDGEGFRNLLDLNLVGYFLTCKHALPHIRQTKGNIVNVASTSGICGQAEAVTYCATKGGVIAMSKALAIDEAKHGVRVNTLSPGGTWTPLLVEHLESLGGQEQSNVQKLANHTLLRRFAEPQEMGKACLFLAADATYTTGEVLSCSGGLEVGAGLKYYN